MSKASNPPLDEPGKNSRADLVKTLICRGLDRTTILAYASEKGWKEEPGDIDHYIAAAESSLVEDAGQIDTEAELGKAIARLNHLYMQCDKVQDFKTALAIQKEINKILALKVAAEKLRAPSSNSSPAERPRLKIVAGKKPG